MEIRESGSKLSFTRVNGYIVPLEQFDRPSLFDRFINVVAVFVIIGIIIFVGMAMPFK